MVKTWMQLAGQLTSEDTHKNGGQIFREQQLNFVEEEFYELLHAFNNEGREQTIKEAIDLIWTAYGFLHIMGVDPDEAFDRIYSSNQTKIPFEYKDGKVQKGKNYVPPYLGDL
jgi:phosphoribosyl-ATP pyrophosphohydrolase